ncbi:hypothetical protein [Burkholderia sp. AU32262]|uniref:hypothetical protein n=1 Tax=Burkholderia sp. AU32262 TaxID=2879630 RepID=UPI001CF5914A|nr:hypothetical protein [Burkholderia sp. AU32262]MCA8241823.1 hypothetical protein [Burkholderia sp. AU32262]
MAVRDAGKSKGDRRVECVRRVCHAPGRNVIGSRRCTATRLLASHHITSFRSAAPAVLFTSLDWIDDTPARFVGTRSANPATAPVAMLARVYRGMTGETSFTPQGDRKHGAMSVFT